MVRVERIRFRHLRRWGVKGFVLGTTLLFGKEKSYSEILKDIRELKF